MIAAPQVVTCDSCGAQIAAGLLACPGCARLVHRTALTALVRAAGDAEKQGDLTAALASWRKAHELLPPKTEQRASIEARMGELGAALHGQGPLPKGVKDTGKSRGAGTFAALGAVGVVLWKFKSLLVVLLANGKLLVAGLLKLPTLLSLLVFAKWSSGHNLAFGMGLVGSIYVHEVGHVAALRKYGIAASAPMFVPGLGAFVRMNQYPVNAAEEARVGLAGPLWGLAVAVAAAALGMLQESAVLISVASAGATLNLFNLIPVWMLDGSRGLRALNRSQRWVLSALALGSALLFHQWMPAIVAVVAAIRALGSDAPGSGDNRVLWKFATLTVLLSLVAMLPVTVAG
jgi:Zn-dependent protease